jgi:hypothetical protein
MAEHLTQYVSLLQGGKKPKKRKELFSFAMVLMAGS